jgi:hypothetical protein
MILKQQTEEEKFLLALIWAPASRLGTLHKKSSPHPRLSNFVSTCDCNATYREHPKPLKIGCCELGGYVKFNHKYIIVGVKGVAVGRGGSDFVS